MAQRYDWYLTDDGSLQFSEDENGDWVSSIEHENELEELRSENERLRENLYDITGRSAIAFKQLYDSLLNKAKEALK